MRSRLPMVVAATLLAGCGSIRTGRDEARVLAPTPPAVDEEPSPRSGSDLGCVAHPRIDAWEQRIRSQHAARTATAAALERGQPYLPRLRRVLDEARLPVDLALLPVVESGFRATARGRHGERGLWQLRPGSARRIGLVVTRKRDDRLDPEREARAAVRHLSALHARYNDWPLTLAAYNAGEGRVDRALARHPDATLWELVEHGRLPRTTREYVPHFLAVVRVTEPTGHCVTGPEGRSPSPDTTAYRSQPAPS